MEAAPQSSCPAWPHRYPHGCQNDSQENALVPSCYLGGRHNDDGQSTQHYLPPTRYWDLEEYIPHHGGILLYEYIHHAGPLWEDESRAIFKEISALSYCLDQGTFRRHLKPGNMIHRNGTIKTINFGLSTQVNTGQKLSFHCGTFSYAVPWSSLADSMMSPWSI